MKLYMIVYLAGKVVGFTGPLDYSYAQCEQSARTQDESCVNGAYRCDQILHLCEWRSGVPAIDPSYIN